MAYLNQPEYVRYACTCGSVKPITKMYFCRHCLKVRCGYCVCHEVDSHYCSNCMENLPSSEARLKKNRCANCYDCPCCLHTLSIRATTTSRSGDDTTKTSTKVYYLACFFCRWTSRDVGIQDQPVASGNWPERENEHIARINTILEFYKMVALREKLEKEKKLYTTPRRTYTHFSEKLGLSGMIARKRAGLPTLPLGRDADPGNPPEIEPAVASEEVEPLPESFLTTAPDLTKITTLKQRFAMPDLQAVSANELMPPHKRLFIKRSQRCRSCEHNVCKTEYNPGSIKFKIQLAAYYHMPLIRILTMEPLRAGRECEIILKLYNPTQHLTSVQFCPLPTPEEEEMELEMQIKQFDKKEQEKPAGRESLLLPSLTPSVSLPEPPRRVNINVTASIALPPGGVILPPRDDAAEYDDSGDTHNFQDDPKVVVWRKGNKAAVRLTITPNASLPLGSPVVAGFVLGYGYVNTMASLEQKEPQRVELQVKVYLTPGNTVGNE